MSHLAGVENTPHILNDIMRCHSTGLVDDESAVHWYKFAVIGLPA
jgi:hypothetical protein